MQIAKNNGLKITFAKTCGGGAKSRLWRKIFANVLNIPVQTPSVEEGLAYGACILAIVANKEYNSLEEATEKLLSVKETIYPEESLATSYRIKYDKFTKFYPALKKLF